MRRPLIIVFIFYISGIVFYNSNNFYFLSAVLTALFLILILKKQKYLMLYCLIFLIFGFLSTLAKDRILNDRYESIKSIKELGGFVLNVDENLFTLKNYEDNYCLIVSLDKSKKIEPGDYIAFMGEIRDRPNYKKINMFSRGIDAYVSCKSDNIKVIDKNSFVTYPLEIRYLLNKKLVDIDSRGGAFISGLVTGYTNDIDEEDVNSFNELGISHILAVSGFNIGIIYFLLTILLRRFSARNRYFLILAICFLYTAIGAFEPSITRAYIMIAIVITAKLLNKYYDILNGIVLAAFIMLLFNAYNLFNIGFQLSFLATAGIILLKDDVKDKIHNPSIKYKDEISVALAALISVFPLVIWYKGVLSIFYLIINIVLSPITAFTTMTSFIASIIFLIFKYKLILYPIAFIGLMIVKGIEALSKYNYLIYFGKPTLAFIIFYYLYIMFELEYIKIRNYNMKKLYRAGFILLIVISLVFTSKDLRIHMINVGQGDSMLIETPDKKLILIDTGPEFKDYSAARTKVIPYIKRLGYNRIDLLVLTHFHNDHAGGLDYILNEFDVKKLAAPEKNDKIKKSLILLSKGDSIKEGEAILNVLLPEDNISSNEKNNENCLVMELLYKDFSMLLTSDAEKNDLDSIEGKDYDVLKVSHHGSYASYSTDLLDNSRIKTALISVGKNSFGHPSVETISSLDKHRVRIYRTDLQGDIVINTDGESYELSVP